MIENLIPIMLKVNWTNKLLIEIVPKIYEKVKIQLILMKLSRILGIKERNLAHCLAKTYLMIKLTLKTLSY